MGVWRINLERKRPFDHPQVMFEEVEAGSEQEALLRLPVTWKGTGYVVTSVTALPDEMWGEH